MSRPPHTLLVIVGLLASTLGPAGARTWIVDAAGAGDFTRIGDACLAAGPGDTVAVNPGDYDEYDGPSHYVFVRDKPLSLLGMGAGPDDVRARISMGFAYCDPVLIRGVTFHDEHYPVWCNADTRMTIQNCKFVDNNAADMGGGAVRCEAELTVEDCVFLRNRTTCENCGGGAINHGGWALTLRRCWFEDNEATMHGGAVQISSGGTIEDCVFLGNRAYNGAALTGGGMQLYGCTFYANETTWSEGAAVEYNYSAGDEERCIIAGTINGYGLGCWGTVTPHCFCFWDNERGATVGDCFDLPSFGNFEADPRFCDAANGNFRLLEDSPCLPGEHGGFSCGLIGAFGAGCVPEPVTETTWGRIKAQFRTVK